MALPARLTWLSVSQRLPPSPVHPTEKWWKGHDKVKGGKKWTESWEKWLTDSLQAAGNGEWLLSRCPLWGPQCIYACYEVIKLHFKVNMKTKCNVFTFSMHFHGPFVFVLFKMLICTAIQMFGAERLSCSPVLHVFDQKYSKNLFPSRSP